jgi:molybdopterin synthase catalytic subunit
MENKVTITEDDFYVDEVNNRIKMPQSGGIVTFTGVVRETTDDKKVSGIEIESYKEMSIKKISELIEQAKSKFNINEVEIIHRVGKLKIGDNIVCISVSAPHRKDAFVACEWLIDELKKIAPIWKHDYV